MSVPPPDPVLPARPCPWMRTLVSGLADGSLRGLSRWFAEQHVAACRPCSHAHRALTALRGRLRGLADAPAVNDALDPGRRQTLERRFDAVDAGAAPEDSLPTERNP